MAAAGGRDQRGPMERLVRIAAVLKVAGERGVSAERLVKVAERVESSLNRSRRNGLVRRNDNVDFFDRHGISLLGGHDEGRGFW